MHLSGAAQYFCYACELFQLSDSIVIALEISQCLWTFIVNSHIQTKEMQSEICKDVLCGLQMADSCL